MNLPPQGLRNHPKVWTKTQVEKLRVLAKSAPAARNRNLFWAQLIQYFPGSTAESLKQAAKRSRIPAKFVRRVAKPLGDSAGPPRNPVWTADDEGILRALSKKLTMQPTALAFWAQVTRYLSVPREPNAIWIRAVRMGLSAQVGVPGRCPDCGAVFYTRLRDGEPINTKCDVHRPKATPPSQTKGGHRRLCRSCRAPFRGSTRKCPTCASA